MHSNQLRKTGLVFVALCVATYCGVHSNTVEAMQLVAKEDAIEIAGRCLNEREDPLADVTVRLFRYNLETTNSIDPPELLVELHTNSDGSFGPFAAQVMRDKYGRSNLVVAATLSKHASRIIGLDSHVEAADLRVELDSEPRGLVGFVRGPDGKPVVDALVYIRMALR